MGDIWAIETDHLTKRYGRVDAVRALTMRVPRGTITGFLGRNGAGKSSTIRMLLGMARPTSGTGRVLGHPIDVPHESVAARRHIAYVAEDKHTYAYLRVGEMIAFTRSFYADWRPDIERALVAELDLPIEQRVGALSKGMRTKLALLLALARRPELLILDEPSEGLDPLAIEQLLRTLVTTAADGTTVFFSSHQIAEVERIADQVCILEQGTLALTLSLDTLRTYRRVSLGFASDPPVTHLASDDVCAIRTSGRQVTLLATSNVEDVMARARGMGAVTVETMPVTLREVFIDTVSGPAS